MCSIVIKENPIPHIPGDGVALCWGVSSNAISKRAVIKQNPVSIADSHASSDIGANIVANDHVACSSYSEERKAIIGIAGNEVALAFRGTPMMQCCTIPSILIPS